MILNWTRKFLFVHVPRTAGTAATSRLITASAAGDICISHPAEAIIDLGGKAFASTSTTPQHNYFPFLGR
jgi:hypothetical protein